jgi:hypothetical protein
MSGVAAGNVDWVGRVGSLGRALVVVLVVFLTAAVVASLGLDAALAAGLVAPESLGALVVVHVLQFVGFGIGVAGYLAVSDDWDLLAVRVPSLRDLGWVAGGVVGILLAAALVGQVLSVFEVDVAQNQVIATGQQNPEYFLYMIPVSLLLVGPFEELVFRGGVQGLLRRTWGGWPAVVIASGLFGLVHWIALVGGGGGRVAYVVVAATLGLILGGLYERTRNLLVPALVHGIYNSVLFGFQYAAAVGLA